jgi:hypothetical protein
MGSDEVTRPESSLATGEPEITAESFGNPRGTLAILAVYGALFAAGWVALYLYFVSRGAPHP